MRDRVVLSTIFLGLKVIDDPRMSLRFADVIAAINSLREALQKHCQDGSRLAYIRGDSAGSEPFSNDKLDHSSIALDVLSDYHPSSVAPLFLLLLHAFDRGSSSFLGGGLDRQANRAAYSEHSLWINAS